MIFVTVGTHEQPFNRLIQKIDELKKDGTIQDLCQHFAFCPELFGLHDTNRSFENHAFGFLKESSMFFRFCTQTRSGLR